MFLSKLRLSNWRNFTEIDVDLGEVVYLLGPNASGKSNLLDVFRFLRDIASSQGGGLRKAVESRGGISKIRSLAARRHPGVGIHIELKSDENDNTPVWSYSLEIKVEPGGARRPVLSSEKVTHNGKTILSRPDAEDNRDKERLTQTCLEQINANKEFREIPEFLSKILYLHLVPQLLRFGDQIAVKRMEADPFGQGFIEMVARTQAKTRASRLRRIQEILKSAIHDFQKLEFVQDAATGTPHLEMTYNHWRAHGARQREDQFSDGTLRLIALIWTLLDSSSMILLEEPELSLHNKIVGQIPKMVYRARESRKKSGGQILISTHSEAMLSGRDIDAGFLLLRPRENGEGTSVCAPSEDDWSAIRAGMSPAEILLPQTGNFIKDF